MSAPPPPPPPAGGLSLYDNLFDPNEKPAAASSTISSAPVLYNTSSTATPEAPKKPIDPALRFQPIRRPPVKTQKAIKVKPLATAASAPSPAQSTTAATPPNTVPSASAAPKSTLADWVNNEQDDFYYGTGEKRQRGGRRSKKKRQHQQAQLETNWDDIYDPARPTNVEEYLKSDEKIDEVREWKALLYRHRRKRREEGASDSDSEAGDAKPAMSNQFAPPANYNFAPPPISPPRDAQPPPPPPPVEPKDSTTISAAPIHYSPPPATADDEHDSHSPPPADASSHTTKSSLPGQPSFARRLMSKYGWTPDTGLGASSTGITTPLSVKVEKRKKRSDAEGGGWAEPANKGRIIGGKMAKHAGGSGDDTKGAISQVVVLRNMLDDMPDLQSEIEDGLGQEIGEECGEKYGRVERLYIDQTHRLVFIKFTDQVSSLRAVNELDGRVFNGHAIAPRFYDVDLFEQGIYDK